MSSPSDAVPPVQAPSSPRAGIPHADEGGSHRSPAARAVRNPGKRKVRRPTTFQPGASYTCSADFCCTFRGVSLHVLQAISVNSGRPPAAGHGHIGLSVRLVHSHVRSAIHCRPVSMRARQKYLSLGTTMGKVRPGSERIGFLILMQRQGTREPIL